MDAQPVVTILKRAGALAVWTAIFFAEVGGFVSFVWGAYLRATGDDPHDQKKGWRLMKWGFFLAISPVLIVALVLHVTQGTQITTPWSR